MKTHPRRLSVEWSVTKTVDLLCVKVLYGRATNEKSITLDTTVQALWLVCQLLSYQGQQIVNVSLNVADVVINSIT